MTLLPARVPAARESVPRNRREVPPSTVTGCSREAPIDSYFVLSLAARLLSRRRPHRSQRLLLPRLSEIRLKGREPVEGAPFEGRLPVRSGQARPLR